MIDGIPKQLKRLRQWVAVKGDSKIPLNPYTGRRASSTDPNTWSDFKTVEGLLRKGQIDYCGFVFRDNEKIVGIDIDAGYDEYGLMSQLAADVIGHCESYTEKSKSGRGFHVLIRGDLPFKGRNNLAGVEIYRTARYFIMTGDTVLYRDIKENQAAIDYVVDKYFPQTRQKSGEAKVQGALYSPVWQVYRDGRIPLRPVYPGIPDGQRNICLTSLAGTLHNQGYSKDQIYNELIFVNKTACKPPLGRGEVRTICDSVTKYKR